METRQIKITCTDTDKTVEADLWKIEPSRITVILPGYQKLTLTKSPYKPNLYTAIQNNLEFYAYFTG